MPTTTSILKAAAAARKRVMAQEDALTSFEWENSAQTYDDFIAYSKYLEKRSNETNDVSDQLTYQTKLRSARRSYTSNELQRSQMAIMEGRAGTQDKMNAVKDLYFQAVDNGDMNLAQNLYSQWDALSIKLQNEQEAAVKAYESSVKSGQANADKVFTDLIKDLTKGVDDVTLPTGTKVTPLNVIARDLEQTGGSSATWEAAQDTLEALRGVVIDQYNAATTQEQIDKLEEKYGAGLQDIDKEIFFSAGGKKLTAQDVVNAAANEQMNNPIYSLKAEYNGATGKNEFKLKENNIERLDYARQFDEQGNEYYAPLQVRTDQDSLFFGQSDQGRGLSTQITDEGAVIGGGQQTGQTKLGTEEVNRDESQSIGNRLKELGVIVKQNGTTLSVKLPGESVEREATIQPDGSIRYFSDDGQLVEMALVRKNLGTDALPQIVEAGQQRLVSPDEISDFGTASAFGGQLSKANAQGDRYLRDIMGNGPKAIGNLNGPIRVGNDFSGFGSPVTTSLLQGASVTRQAIQQEQARQLMLQAQAEQAARLQASATFNLNQTPVQQLASNGVLKSQLRVAAPTPQPRLYVAPPAPTPKITSVGVAQPTGRVTVGAPAPTPRVVVR